MTEIKILPRAKKSLKKLNTQIATELLLEFSDFIQKNTNFLSSYKIRKIVGTDFYRYKLRDLRIIFDIQGNIVFIFDVRKRNEKTYKF